MANPYVSVSISGYNATPPSDDGAQTTPNKVEWAKHKEKLGDPLKTAIEAINANANTAFGAQPGSILQCGSTGTPGGGATVFLGPTGHSSTETEVEFPSPFTGTLEDLYVLSSASPGAGETFTYTVRVTGADTSITTTTSDTARTSSDTSNTAAITAGQRMSVKLVTSAGAAAVRHHLTLRLTPA